jgi:hypothetical protein
MGNGWSDVFQKAGFEKSVTFLISERMVLIKKELKRQSGQVKK